MTCITALKTMAMRIRRPHRTAEVELLHQELLRQGAPEGLPAWLEADIATGAFDPALALRSDFPRLEAARQKLARHWRAMEALHAQASATEFWQPAARGLLPPLARRAERELRRTEQELRQITQRLQAVYTLLLRATARQHSTTSKTTSEGDRQ